MKCGEPMPGDSYRTCDRDLKHRGDHAYLNSRWPRLVPARPDWDVQELLDQATSRDAWGIEERSFPIIVTETVTRVLWVDAETEDDALAYWADDYSDIPLKDADVIEGYLEFERPDKRQRAEAFRSSAMSARGLSKIGPLQKCPGCDAEAFGSEWLHNVYRKCHGPIEWRMGGHGRPMREWQYAPAFDGAQSAEAAVS